MLYQNFWYKVESLTITMPVKGRKISDTLAQNKFGTSVNQLISCQPKVDMHNSCFTYVRRTVMQPQAARGPKCMCA